MKGADCGLRATVARTPLAGSNRECDPLPAQAPTQQNSRAASAAAGRFIFGFPKHHDAGKLAFSRSAKEMAPRKREGALTKDEKRNSSKLY